MIEKEKRLRELIEGKRDAYIAIVSRPSAEARASAAKRELDELLVQQRELASEIRLNSPDYAALTQPQVATAPEVHQLLDEHTVLLTFALAEPRSYVWAVTRNRVEARVLPPEPEIAEAARRFHELLRGGSRQPDETFAEWDRRSRRAQADIPNAASALSRLVLSPVASQLNAKRIVIVSDGALHLVPFGALPTTTRFG